MNRAAQLRAGPRKARAALLATIAAALGCAGAGPSGGRILGESPGLEGDTAPGVELVLVKGGCFPMGADKDDCDATPDERPVHEVCVGDFLIGRTEVTRRQWRAITGGSAPASGGCSADDCPVVDVSWSEVQEFLRRLEASPAGGGRRYRLPTEAEWEYAARSGGRVERYAGAKVPGPVAWFADNAVRVNHPVGTKAPNGLGLFDMSGNVWEMTGDWYDGRYYSVSPRDNPTGPSEGEDHVIRGGGRSDGYAGQRTTRRSTVRARTGGNDRSADVGFRLTSAP